MDQNNQYFALLNKGKHYYSCTSAFKLVFWLKRIVRWVSRCAKIPHSIHSLSISTILSTTVLNVYISRLTIVSREAKKKQAVCATNK